MPGGRSSPPLIFWSHGRVAGSKPPVDLLPLSRLKRSKPLPRMPSHLFYVHPSWQAWSEHRNCRARQEYHRKNNYSVAKRRIVFLHLASPPRATQTRYDTPTRNPYMADPPNAVGGPETSAPARHNSIHSNQLPVFTTVFCNIFFL